MIHPCEACQHPEQLIAESEIFEKQSTGLKEIADLMFERTAEASRMIADNPDGNVGRDSEIIKGKIDSTVYYISLAERLSRLAPRILSETAKIDCQATECDLRATCPKLQYFWLKVAEARTLPDS